MQIKPPPCIRLHVPPFRQGFVVPHGVPPPGESVVAVVLSWESQKGPVQPGAQSQILVSGYSSRQVPPFLQMVGSTQATLVEIADSFQKYDI